MLGESQLPAPAAHISRKRRWDKDVTSDREASDGSPICSREEQVPMEVADLTGSPICGKEAEEEEEEEQPPMETAAAVCGPVSNMEEGTEEPEIPPWDRDGIPVWDSDDDGGILLKTRPELEELHIARYKTIIELDPKKNLVVPTRFCSINIADFDLDKESKFSLGPPLDNNMTPELELCMVPLGINVISVKVIESDRGYPIRVFGTVLARDMVDYRCVYLFRREREDPQIIYSKDDMLALTGPRRGLVPPQNMYFEFNLKVKGDPDEDFSKGVIDHHVIPSGPITRVLTSWLSRVELVFVPIQYPVAASLQVNILKGPPFTGKVLAGPGTIENAETRMIVYDSRATEGGGGTSSSGDGGSVVLSRNLIAVPVPAYDNDEDEIVVHVRFLDHDDDVDDEDPGTLVTLQYPDEEQVCSHGSCEMQVKVVWTAILNKPTAKYILTRGTTMPGPYTCPDYEPLF